MANFSVSNGQIIGPDGQPFVAEGVDIWSNVGQPSVIGDPAGAANLIGTLFPNANMVRIAAGDGYSTDSAAALMPFINLMTAKGIVVEIGNYNPALTNNVATGAALAQELSWYASLATAFKGNPYVWFSTDNEPSDGQTFNGATSAEQLAVYNTIRATGSDAMIGLENTQWTIDGNHEQSASISQGDISGMTNVHWDDHYYNWLSDFSTSVSANQSALQAEVAGSQVYTDADGKIPVIVGEYGTATTGNGTDPGATQTVAAVLQSGLGSTAWGINSGGTGDQLVNGNSLTSFGQQVAAAETAPPPPPNGGSGSGTGNGAVVIVPGSGSFTDAAGNVYTIDDQDNAVENGKLIPDGSDTAEMELFNGTVYGQDAASGQWFVWNQINWQAAPSDPDPPTGGSGGGTPPPPPPTPSPNGTTITSAAAAPIIDQAENSWSLVRSASKGLQIAVNGVVDIPTANVVLLETLNGAMVQENASGNWYSESQPNDSWVQLAGNPNAPPVPTFPTATDFLVTPGTGSFTAAGKAYSIDAAGNADQNGAAIPGGGGTSAMASFPGTIYGQDSASGQWYTLNGTNWTATAPTLIDATSTGSINQALPRSGTVTENGDTFTMSSGNVIKATLGSGNDNIGFIAARQVTLTGGSGKAEVLAAGGNNTFTAGSGSLDVAAGAGSDAYVFHAGDGLLTVEDFSMAKGDTLTIDKSLQGSMTAESDGHGGTALVFAANSAIDLKGVAATPTIHWQ